MRTYLRAGTGAVVALGIAVAPVVLATSAGAAPYTDDPSTSLSTTNPSVGGPLTVFGKNWSDSKVEIDLHSTVTTLGQVNVNSDGTFTATFTLPASFEGKHYVTTTGLTTGDITRNDICIGDCSQDVGGVEHGQGGSDDGTDLPRTGAAAVGIGLAGAALLGSGVALRRASRRR